MTGEGGGTVNSANLNGTGAMPLASIQAVPMGIAVDGSRSKLYWTNSRGRIQSANLNGSGIKNVVSGLGSPGDMVLSNSIAAPTAAPAGTASGSKYDVNGDGAVDAKDSDALIIAVAAEITDAKYDVNGDGTVDINDVVAVRANRDPGAAGAPTLVGMKLSAVQIDRLQEQIDLLIATNDRSPAATADADLSAAASRDGTSRENAVACELSESVQPRNVDSLRVGDGYGCAHHDLQHAGCCDPVVCSLDISRLATTWVGIVRRIGMVGMRLANRLRVVCISISSKPMRCR